MITVARRHRWDLLYELVSRYVRLRYRRSVLGVLWSQLGPLSTVVVLSVLFTRVVDLGIPNYPVFVFIGLLAWTWFRGGLVSATESVVGGRELVGHPGIPLSLLPTVPVVTHLVNYLLALPILLGAIVVTTGRLPMSALALPVVLAIQFGLILGPAFAFAATNVRFRDTGHLVDIVLLPLFYATPIFYDASRVLSSDFSFAYQLNPLARLMTTYRGLLLEGVWPDPAVIGGLGALAAVLLVLGHRVYSRAAHRFPEEL